MPYKTWLSLVDTAQLKAKIRLQRARHFLGSAYVEIDLHYPESAEKKRIVFFGDLGVPQGRNLLGFSNLLTVYSRLAHLPMVNRLAQSAQPAIVIAGNGMCSSGRIVNYLKAMLHDLRHDVLFVGYQAWGTPRAIQIHGPGGGYVDLDGERYKVGGKITTIGDYSAHSDQKGLLSFVTRMRHWPSDIRIVHGDAAAKVTLAERFKA